MQRKRSGIGRGFTLLELLITLAIAAVVVGGAVLALPPSGQRELMQEAERLAAQLEVARAQSRASGQMVWAHIEAQGWRWQGLPRTQQALGVEAVQPWLHPDTQAAAARVQLGPEPVIAAQHVLLWNAQGIRAMVHTDGVRPFAVVPQP